jgi:spore germination protein YaaH
LPALLAFGGTISTGTAAPPPSRPSIHQVQLETHDAMEARGVRFPGDRPAFPGDRPASAPRGRDQYNPASTGAYQVHGWHPYWMGTSYLDYDWSLVSTVAFFSLELDGNGSIVNDHAWPWTGLVSAAHAGGARVIVTATLFSSSSITALLSDPGRRAAAAANLVAATLAGDADGVDIDFEGVAGSQRANLVTFMQELRSALDAAIPGAYLSMATPAVDWSNAFDYPALAVPCDHLVLMGYDYHWSTSPDTGPVAPLSGWGTYNVTWSVNDYLGKGVPPGKLLLGVPYYGYRWPAVSGDPGAATTGSATARTFAQAVPESEAYGLLRDPASGTPWYRFQSPGWFQAWFDDAASLTMKYDLVKEDGLGGVGIWALGYDGSRPELWDALAAAFADPATGVPSEDPAPEPLALSVPHPNPVRAEAAVRLELAAPARVRLALIDAGGREVRLILDAKLPAGERVVHWSAARLPSGLYFLTARAGGFRRAVKVLVLG